MRRTDALAPLAHSEFRRIWLAGLAVNVGMWMQNVGAAWLMTGLDATPMMVALIQTATALPVFLFGLPGGVLADLMERRRLLLGTQIWMCAVAVVLSVCTLAGWMNAWLLLLLTFALGTGFALQVAAFQAIASDIVPHDKVAAAVTLNGISFNAGRAVGPALAGLIIVASGTGAVFIVDVLCFAWVIRTLIRWRPARPAVDGAPQRVVPAERLLGGILAGMRYVRHAPHLRIEMLRIMILISCASALWALLPLVARDQLGFGASGYGLLLGSLGMGAVVGALVLAPLRDRYGLDRVIAVGGAVFAATILTVAFAHQMVLLCLALVAGGSAWIAISSTVQAVVQMSVPAWIRARAVAVFILIFQGTMAFGGAFWGLAANHIGVPDALALAAGLLGCGVLYTRRHPVHFAQESEVTLSAPRGDNPDAFGAGLQPDDGPVAVQIDYRVVAATRAEFVRDVHALGVARLRNGAAHWRLYRDLGASDRYAERFVVDSWAAYLRHRRRATVADRIVETRVRAWLEPGAEPLVTRYIAEDRMDDPDEGTAG